MRGARWAFLIVGLAAVLAADRVFLRYWDFGAASGELDAAVRDYRAAGLPWTARDIAPPPVPPYQNAAPLIRSAIASLPIGKALSTFETERIEGKRVAPPPELSTTLRFAHLAAQRPQLDFARDWDLGPNLLTEPGKIKDLCRILAARAEFSAARGDDAGTMSDLEDVRRLAALVGQSPSMLEALVATACDAMAMKSAQECLVLAAKDIARLKRYRHWLATPAPLPELKRAFRSTIYSTVVFSRNMDRMGMGKGVFPLQDYKQIEDASTDYEGGGHGELPAPTMRRDGLPENTRSRAYMARCLQMWTELALATHNLTELIDMITAQAEQVAAHYENSRGMSYAFVRILFPDLTEFSRLNLVTEANRAVTLAFADGLIQHSRTGHWPTKFTTPDPLGTGPLRTRFDNGRFRVWSVGPNGKDDGGLLPRETEAQPTPDDIVAVYPPVPKRPPHIPTSYERSRWRD